MRSPRPIYLVVLVHDGTRRLARLALRRARPLPPLEDDARGELRKAGYVAVEDGPLAATAGHVASVNAQLDHARAITLRCRPLTTAERTNRATTLWRHRPMWAPSPPTRRTPTRGTTTPKKTTARRE